MSQGDLQFRLWGRPLKPLAVGCMVALTGLTLNGVFTWLEKGSLLLPTDDDPALGLYGAISLALMIVSYWKASQRLFETALLFTMGAFITRATLLTLTEQYLLHGLMPLSIAIFAGGAYMLERADKGSGRTL